LGRTSGLTPPATKTTSKSFFESKVIHLREDICTIPISEVFEPMDGCPVCRMRDMLQERLLDYILGAAMMEPDVRMETNKAGFCGTHYALMLKRRNRLALALMLQSHLQTLQKDLFKSPMRLLPGAKTQKAEQQSHRCFICQNIDHAMDKLLHTLFVTYEKERDFRTLFAQQPCLCLPHYSLLLGAGKKRLSGRMFSDFSGAAETLAKGSLAELQTDVNKFCQMFDYRSGGADADWGNARDAIERAVAFLTGQSR